MFLKFLYPVIVTGMDLFSIFVMELKKRSSVFVHVKIMFKK